MFTLSLTGHRPDKLWGYNLNNPHYQKMFNKLYSIIINSVKIHGEVECHSGMALDADTVWAFAIIHALRDLGKDKVHFIADVPCLEQGKVWQEIDRKRYSQLLSYAEKKVVYSEKYTKQCMMLRNIGMVDSCDILIAIYNNDKTGGTAMTVNYGRNKGKHIITIPPNSL